MSSPEKTNAMSDKDADTRIPMIAEKDKSSDTDKDAPSSPKSPKDSPGKKNLYRKQPSQDGAGSKPKLPRQASTDSATYNAARQAPVRRRSSFDLMHTNSIPSLQDQGKLQEIDLTSGKWE